MPLSPRWYSPRVLFCRSARGSSSVSASSASNSTYRPDIDGLRSLAVLPVVAYHAGAPGVSGGFAGVDIFFVISGFLITSLVREQIVAGQFTLSGFYARRARRLFPALMTMLVVSSGFAWWLLMPTELEDFGESLATAAAFSSNILFWSEAGYFDGPSDFKPLLHTWSLAVEEHFYLFFPALLLFLRAARVRTMILVVVGLLVLSFALQLLYLNKSPDAAFFLSPNRFWELLIGSVTAIALRHSSVGQCNQLIRETAATTGLFCIGFTLFFFSDATSFPGAAALVPCVGTALIIFSGAGGSSRVNRALQWRPLVLMGLLSYSLYLWHWPILVFLKHFTVRDPTIIETTTAVAASFILAWLSWRFVERPFHTPPAQREPKSPNRAVQPTTRTTLKVSGWAIGVLVAIGVTLDQFDGVPQRLPEEVVQIAKFSDDKPAERKRCTGKSATQVRSEGLCKISLKNTTQATPDFLVWGDSHAMILAPTFAQVAAADNRSGLNATRNGCAPLLGAFRPTEDPGQECVAFNEAILEVIEQTPSITNVILIARWAMYLDGNPYKHESGKVLQLVDSDSTEINSAESRKVARRSLERSIAKLQQLGKQVTIFASAPEVGWNTPIVLAKSVWRGRDLRIAPSTAEHLARQRSSTELLTDLTDDTILLLNPATTLCPDTWCRVQKGGKPLYIDEDHLSSVGTRELAPLVKRALQ